MTQQTPNFALIGSVGENGWYVMEIGEEICVEGCECFRVGIFVCVLDFWTDSMGIFRLNTLNGCGAIF